MEYVCIIYNKIETDFINFTFYKSVLLIILNRIICRNCKLL